MRYLRNASPKLLKGKALVRLDFNTEDEWRMETTLPTLRLLGKAAERIVIMSHRGRPKRYDAKLSLRRDAKALSKFLKKPVRFVSSLRFADMHKAIARAPRRSFLLLENLRFMKGEEANDHKFARELASLADYYVNDAFAVSHRDDASVDAITRFLPSYAGLELEKEVKVLGGVRDTPKKPFVVILGGGKAHDKLGVMRSLRSSADYFIIGGAAANTLLFLNGIKIGSSLIDKDPKDFKKLKEVLKWDHVTLPLDWKVEKGKILDIGEWTLRDFMSKIRVARTIIWSGPMGVIERGEFAHGTEKIAQAIIENKTAFSVAGGGETVMFLKKHKLDKKFGFISTGGTAMLDFFAGETLPGIAALERKPHKAK